MNRTWITTLTLATVIGSGGALAGVLAANNERPAVAQAQSSPLPAAFVEPTTPALEATGTVAYQVGSAGMVTVSVANAALNVDGATPSPGWSTVSTSAPGTHVDVQFTDTTQLVTFSADLVDNNVVVQVSNVPVATTPTTAAASSTSASSAPRSTQQPAAQPAAPQPAAAPTQAAPTAAPARGDDGGGDDHYGDDEHETESNDD